METDNGFEKIVRDPEIQRSKPLDQDIDSLQKENQELKEKINTERFCGLLIVIILFDCWAFSSSENWGTPIVIGFLEIILLTIISKKLAVTDITLLTDKLLGALNHQNHSN